MQIPRATGIKLAGFAGVTAVALAANHLGLGEHATGLLGAAGALVVEGARAVWGHLGVHLIETTAGHGGSERARSKQNRDLHRLMGEAIARILDREAERAPGGKFGRDYLKGAAAAFRSDAWMNLELTGPETAIGEAAVPSYFTGDGENIKHSAVLEQSEWIELVKRIAPTYILDEPAKALDYAASKLREHFALELWEAAKDAWKTRDLAWPALVLRLLSLILSRASETAPSSAAIASRLTELRIEVSELSNAIGKAVHGVEGVDADADMGHAISDYQVEVASKLAALDTRIKELHNRHDRHDADLAEIKAHLASHPPRVYTLHSPFESVPPFPPNYFQRKEDLDQLRSLILRQAASGTPTAVEGMGGIGKTVLVIALCHDPTVREAFPGGIVWLKVGKEFGLRTIDRLKKVAEWLNENMDDDTEERCRARYRKLLASNKVLIILDSVWHSMDIDSFRQDSPGSCLLYTTRELSIAGGQGAQKLAVPRLDKQQSRRMLAGWSGLNSDKLPAAAEEVLDECDGLALALAMIGAVLRDGPNEKWSRVLKNLREARLKKIEGSLPGYEYANLDAAIAVSVDELDAITRDRYLKLAILLDDMVATPPICRTLWNVSEDDAADTVDEIVNRSLARREEGGIRLHNLQSAYVTSLYPDREALALVHGAMRLSEHVIEKDPTQFASQLTGRLLPHRGVAAIQQFLSDISRGAPPPWIRPFVQAIHPPGTALVRTMKGDARAVNSVAMSPDGRRAVSASDDTTLKVWDLETGRLLRSLEGHSAAVIGVAMDPDGRRAVSGSYDCTLKVWDLETGLVLRTLRGHSFYVAGVAVTRDGRFATSASGDATVKVWDFETGQLIHTLEGHSDLVTAVDVSPDGLQVVSASWDKTLKVWDLKTGRLIRTLEGHAYGVKGVVVCPDGRRIVSASNDTTLKVWDLETGRLLRTLKGHSYGVNCVAVSSNGQRMVSGSDDDTLKVWDLGTFQLIRTLEGHSGWVRGVALGPDGRRAVSAATDGTVKVWNLTSGRPLGKPEKHAFCVNCVAVSRDARRAVSGSTDETLKVWDPETGQLIHTLEGHSEVNGVALSSDGRRAVSAFRDYTLKVWDLHTRQLMHTLRGHSNAVTSVAVSPTAPLALSASHDNTLRVWDLETGQLLRTLQGSRVENDVAFSPDGRCAISASDDKLELWDVETGRLLRTLEGHSNLVSGVAVSRDGRVVSASWDSTLRVWDLETGELLCILVGHSSGVSSVEVSPDGQLAVSTSSDNTVKIWDLQTAAPIATFSCDGSPLCSAFVNDRKMIIGDFGGYVHFLALELGEQAGTTPSRREMHPTTRLDVSTHPRIIAESG